ncbi:MAG: helicase-related protein [Acidobacteriota bacterium]
MTSLLDAIEAQQRCDRLSAPATAAIDLHPFQLEPAIAMTIRGTPRVLLADAVGLGKTIQAGLVLAELFARRACRRALILTPSGLRDQWADELRCRFGLEAIVADAAWLEAMQVGLPASVNPWSIEQVMIASTDFVKRADVLRGLEPLAWDLVVVDEAHTASADSQRRVAADALARRARRVMLLTATPHSGDQSAFDALCRIGSMADDEPIALFRRSRSDAGFRSVRRVRLLPVRQTDIERELHHRLLAYVGRLWRERRGDTGGDARLAAIVLLKRAFSSAQALAESIAFRRDHLANPAAALVEQLEFPFDPEASSSDETPLVALATPGFDDEKDEKQTLGSLADLAYAAARTDSKVRTIGRLIGRLREPCIVFTEYRDTLAALARSLPEDVTCASLHGGLERWARADAVRQFTSGGARVLLATDAGGEGLNLQATCRLVVNLELPWNPIRLEQRIGRVDRIGQRRTVHAINLVASGTYESALLARLVARIDCARDAVGPIDEVLGSEGDLAIAAEMAGMPMAEPPWARRPTPESKQPGPRLARVALDQDARRQRDDLAESRRVREAIARRTRRVRRRAPVIARRSLPEVAAVPLRRLKGVAAQPGAVAVYDSTCVDDTGRRVDGVLLPLFSPFMLPHLRDRADVVAMAKQWLAAQGPEADAVALQVARARCETARQVCADQRAAEVMRARAQRLVSVGDSLMIQAGLFDRRAEREVDQRRTEASARDAATDVGLEEHVDARDIALAEPPHLRLVLMVMP